jgi:hypothetical protein
VGLVSQSVCRMTTGWTVRGSNPGGGEIFRTCPDRLWDPPSLLYNGYRVFPGGGKRPGREADPSTLIVPRYKKSSAIPLLSLRAFVACKVSETYLLLYMIHFVVRTKMQDNTVLSNRLFESSHALWERRYFTLFRTAFCLKSLSLLVQHCSWENYLWRR